MYPPPQPPPFTPQPRRTPRALVAALGCGGVLVVLLLLGLLGSLVEDPAPSPAASSAPARPAPATTTARPVVTARQVVAEVEKRWPLPNQRDNTHACSPDCLQLITTDTVSVYQFRDAATARRWGAGATADIVGPILLSYAGTEQRLTSDEARADIKATVRRMLR